MNRKASFRPTRLRSSRASFRLCPTVSTMGFSGLAWMSFMLMASSARSFSMALRSTDFPLPLSPVM